MVDVRACWIPAILAVAACSVENPLFDLPEPSGGGSGSGLETGGASTTDESTSDMSSGSGSSASSTTTTATTNTTDPAPVCGNGVKELGEECDDNAIPGDDCELNCNPLFRPYDTIAIPIENARTLAVADFTGDGLADVAFAMAEGTCGDGSCVRTFRNEGDGAGFTEVTLFPKVGISVARLVVGEWNGDGKLDIAGADGSGLVVLYQGSDQPTPVTFLGKPDTLLGAQLGGDDGIDLLMVDPGGMSIGKLLANKTQPLGFEPPVQMQVAHPPERFAVAEVDKVAELDIVYSVFQGADAGFFTRLGLGANAPELGPFASQTGQARAIAVGDFGAPPYPNVVLSDPNPMLGKHTVQIFNNLGGGNFERVVTLEGEPDTRFVRLVPLDNGESENVIALATTALQIFTFTGDKVVAGPSRNFAGSLVDFDAGQLGGDGRTDLAVLSTFGCYVLVNRSGEG